MTEHIFRVRGEALRQFLELPAALRKEAAVAILALGAEPRPAWSRPYGDIPDAYRLEWGSVTVFYRITSGEGDASAVDVLVINPNT